MISMRGGPGSAARHAGTASATTDARADAAGAQCLADFSSVASTGVNYHRGSRHGGERGGKVLLGADLPLGEEEEAGPPVLVVHRVSLTFRAASVRPMRPGTTRLSEKPQQCHALRSAQD